MLVVQTTTKKTNKEATKSEKVFIGNSRYILTNYYPDGSIFEKGEIIQDVKDGTWVGWFENGSLKYRENYHLGKFFGDVEKYYPNNQLELKGSYNYDVNLDGAYIEFYKNGDTLLFGHYYNGQKIEFWKYYSGDTIIVEKYNSQNFVGSKIRLVKNKRQGKSYDWFPSGGLAFSKTYDNGKLNGETIIFFENGDTNELGNYHNNAVVGEWKTWYKNGDLNSIEIGDSNDLKLMEYWDSKGKHKIINGNGKLFEIKYKNGLKISK